MILVPLAAIMLFSFRKMTSQVPTQLVYRAVVMDIGSREPVQGVTLTDAVSGQKAVTNSKGIVELKFNAEGKQDMKLEYSRDGYTRMTSMLSYSSKKPEATVILTELVGIRKGNSTDQCAECFTTLFMEENGLLENPRKALEKHFEGRSRGDNGVATARPADDVVKEEPKTGGTANRVVVSGNSARVEPADGGVVLSNAIIKPSGKPFAGLVIMNDREMSWSQFEALADSLQRSNKDFTNGIAEIQVLNATEAKAIYGDKGANGVILIKGKLTDK